MDKEIALWIIGLFVTVVVAPVVGFILTRSFSHGDRLTKIETDISWIRDTFAVAGKKAARVLHSPHTPVLDALLEKYEAETISWSEVNRLYKMLEDIINDLKLGKDVRMAASILLTSIALRYKGELEHLNKP